MLQQIIRTQKQKRIQRYRGIIKTLMVLSIYKIMNYTDIIRDLLAQQYPSPEETANLVITNIVLRILPLPAKPYFLRYENLETLVISKCDLRNLQNFPKITSLKQLDLSDNSLQGTLNYLMPLNKLNYLNIANNLINDFRKLQPLQTIDGLEIYVTGNPFIDGETWKTKVKNYGLKVLKQPRVLQVLCKKVKQQTKKEEKKQQKPPQQMQQLNNNHIETEVHARQNLFMQMRARRHRTKLEQQQIMLEKRNNLLNLQSDSLSLFADLGQHEIHNMFQNDEDEQSEQLNDFDNDNEESDKDQKDDQDNEEEEDEQPEDYMKNDFGALLDPFDADQDMQRQEDQSEESPSD